MTLRIKSCARSISLRQRLLLFFVAVWLVRSVGMAWPGGLQSSPTVTTWYKGNTSMTVKVAATTFAKYRIQFIGSGGGLSREVADSSAEYSFTGNEGYVWAKVLESYGLVAWCQPALVPRR